MNKGERLKLLKNVDLFGAFSLEELEQLAAQLEEIHLAKDEILFEEGDPHWVDMFILLSGELKVYKKNRALTLIKPVDYIGEMAIIEKKPRSATVVAGSPSTLLRITSAQFENYIAKQPQPIVSLMRTLSQRIRSDNELIAQEFEKANILIHDMRNQLSAFLLLDVLGKKLDLSESDRRIFTLMRKSRLDLNEMMEEALANAKRLQHNKIICENDLVELLQELSIAELPVHPDFQEIKLKTEFDDVVPPFRFHRLDIKRLITNLAINAAQASTPGSSVRIGLKMSDPKNVQISITDTGKGIPEDIQKRIFLPRFTTKESGNGLGLASCREIVKEHQGQITFTSAPGQGTTFQVLLPLKNE